MKRLRAYSGHAEMKTYMKTIHSSAKGASAIITDSPWGMYFNPTNNPAANIEAYISRPLPSIMGVAGNAFAVQTSGSQSQQSESGGSIPSTPMSAALGPAAQATIPTKQGSQSSQSRAGINVFERMDRFAASQANQRGNDFYRGRAG
jgi:hypothetical protein